MKRWLSLIFVLAIGVGALVLSQRRKPEVDPGPNALVNMVADAQREASRVPARLTRISDSEEISIGDQMAHQYLATGWRSNRSPDDLLVQAYVERVGNRVMPYATRKLPYKFHYIPDKYFFNAFALPGGHVFIGKGLISLMKDEDELAAVLGHELEHIDLYHCAERVQFEARMRKLPMGELGSLVTLPIKIFQAGYSKEQEFEADRQGTRLAVRAGYSPYGAIDLFESLERAHRNTVRVSQTPQEEILRGAWGTLEGYFRSHPLPAERISQVQRLIEAERWQNRTVQKPLEPMVTSAIGNQQYASSEP